MPSRVARLRLAQAVETQFDTSVVAAFEAILAGATEDYRLARSGEFIFEARELGGDRITIDQKERRAVAPVAVAING
jgi:hypothetical protein